MEFLNYNSFNYCKKYFNKERRIAMTDKEKIDNIDFEEIKDEELDKVTGGKLDPPRVDINKYDDTVLNNV
jgi:bacteriocin-like protein